MINTEVFDGYGSMVDIEKKHFGDAASTQQLV